MTTKLDPKFLAFLADTAQKLQTLEIEPRVLAEVAPALSTATAELSQRLIDYVTQLTAAMEAKNAADIAEREAAKAQALAEKEAARITALEAK